MKCKRCDHSKKVHTLSWTWRAGKNEYHTDTGCQWEVDDHGPECFCMEFKK